MKPDNSNHRPPEEDLRLPPEVLEALERTQPGPIVVRPEIDAAVLRTASAKLSAIRDERRRWGLKWSTGAWAAAACLTLYFAFSRDWKVAEIRQANTNPKEVLEGDAAAMILHEMSAIFPNQLRAIVRDSSGLRFSLAENADVDSEKALVIKVCDSEGCREIITFIGQTINVAGHKVAVREEAGGRIVLDGDGFHWASDNPVSPLPSLQIGSRILQSNLTNS